MGDRSDLEINEAHKRRMAEVQAEHRARIRAAKAADAGLLLVHTGDGKGKSTAAFGTIVRALGWGHSVGVVQFIKGNWEVGERRFFDRFDDLITWHTMGEGFTWDTQDRARDIAAAEAAWQTAQGLMTGGDYDLIVLDELNIVLRYGYLDVDAVVAGLAGRYPRTSVIVTGRDAPEALRQAADLVSEVAAVRHPFDRGIKAKRGIDF
ncbi:cob(I)yrinic acid a,c-diamide adenosyltransferase [Rhodothalassium salexigens]|uniref:cob(I)yrinic acid a,c-diamide adenosyltransferase n=1 Tax=Rhodothalassium salexigens TaxID=1086 RepID=UPI001912BF63|nr:cob(I)yrinic acid a,c-diamide adenosyltransferase [Rhodothalassium salexigens]MBK5910710.1 cob(I)yrinic acid a,c-diamide adenosyltransferase [Rhodothalassium salexigens]